MQETSRTFTRRAALRTVGGALLATGLARGENSGAAGKAFTFIEINDLHYLTDECGKFFEQIVPAIKESAPQAAFCLIAGDLADRGDAESLNAVREHFSKLGCPLHPVPGNHDHLTNDDRSDYEKVFPGKSNYRFDHEGWQIIGLDSTQGTLSDETYISDVTIDWLKTEMTKLDRKKPTVAFTHFPLGEGAIYRPLNAGAVLEELLKLNLRAVFSGHWHGLSERKVRQAMITINRCCARIRGNRDGSPLKGWFLCEAMPGGELRRRFVAAPEVKGIPVAR